MKITYKNTFMDIIKYQLYGLLIFPMKLYLIVIPVMLSLLSVDTFNDSNEFDYMKFLVLFIIFFIVSIFLLVSVIFVFTLYSMNKKNSKSFYCIHSITFEDENLIEETEFNKNIYKWSGIYDYNENKEYIGIFVSKLQAHIIPKKALSNEEIENILNILKFKVSKKTNNILNDEF